MKFYWNGEEWHRLEKFVYDCKSAKSVLPKIKVSIRMLAGVKLPSCQLPFGDEEIRRFNCHSKLVFQATDRP